MPPRRSCDIDFRGKIRSLDGNNETDNRYPKETNSTCNRIRLRKCTGLYVRQVTHMCVCVCVYGRNAREGNNRKGKINELTRLEKLPVFIFHFYFFLFDRRMNLFILLVVQLSSCNRSVFSSRVNFSFVFLND